MLYSVAVAVLRVLFFLLGLKTEGIHKLPEKGPVIVAANHVSNWDPIIVAVALKRPIYFMAKEELFKNKLLGILLAKLHAFPVRRGSADIKAIRKAMEILADGQVLGIFPEGSRKKVAPDSTVQAGVAMIALKSRTPVLPIACLGTERSIPFGWTNPLLLRVGELIKVEKYAEEKVKASVLEKLSNEIMERINKLKINVF
jgi:1-acyl-sn-glycerol-3-phosphate acyltransferase